jgi:hypothetical protein
MRYSYSTLIHQQMHKTALQSVRKGSKLLHFTHQIWKNNAEYEENVKKKKNF